VASQRDDRRSLAFRYRGAVLVGIGGFFLFARPALLPEDLRYLNRPDTEIDAAVPACVGG